METSIIQNDLNEFNRRIMQVLLYFMISDSNIEILEIQESWNFE